MHNEKGRTRSERATEEPLELVYALLILLLQRTFAKEVPEDLFMISNKCMKSMYTMFQAGILVFGC